MTLQNLALSNFEEGQTICYSPNNQTDLDDIICITTRKDNMYLHLESELDLYRDKEHLLQTQIDLLEDEAARITQQYELMVLITMGAVLLAMAAFAYALGIFDTIFKDMNRRKRS